MNAGAALNLLLKPDGVIVDQFPLTTAQVTDALSSIRQLLSNLLHTCPNESEIAHFCQLASLDTIFRLLERRQHPDCSTIDSWPNLLLLELCDFAYARTSSDVALYTRKDCSNTSLALRRIRLAACSQLPVLRDSIIPFLSRVDTSPLGRTMALRLLHLSIVIIPSISPPELKPDPSFLRAFWPSLLAMIRCIANGHARIGNQEQTFHALSLISTIGCSELDIVHLHPFVTRQVQVASLEMLEDALYQTSYTGEILAATLVDSPLVQWLLSCFHELEETAIPLPILYLVGKCLILCASSDQRWRAIIVPMVKSCAHELVVCIRVLLDSANTACPLPASALVSAVTRCLVHISGENISILRASDIQCNLIETLVRLYFAFEDSEICVKGDLVVCIFTLSQILDQDMSRDPSLRPTDSTWRETTILQMLSQAESLIADTTSICLLTCATYEADLSRDLTDGIHALVSTLQTRSSSPCVDIDHLAFLQSLFVLSSCLWSGKRHPPMHTWVAQLHLAGPSADRDSHLQLYDRFIFVQRVLLLAERSLLFTLSAERLVAIYHSLINIVVLHPEIENSLGFEGAGDDTMEAILDVLSAPANSMVEYMISSPWTSLLRQKLSEERQGSQREMGSSREEVLKMLTLVLAGKPKGERKQRSRRRLKLMRTASERLLFFV